MRRAPAANIFQGQRFSFHISRTCGVPRTNPFKTQFTYTSLDSTSHFVVPLVNLLLGLPGQGRDGLSLELPSQ